MSPQSLDYSRVAVLIPCYNEELTVEQVVRDFQKSLPGAKIYVYDNNSSDQTATKARQAGAIVVPSPRQGKGYVVCQMFAEIEADCYVMADGDATYPADYAPQLIQTLSRTGADMVVGSRLQKFTDKSFRRFHKFGNKLITGLIKNLFDVEVRDVLSGYRVFSKKFVKCVPLSSKGFEIETELTLQATAKNFRIAEVDVPYGERPEMSFSKLNTFSDGWLIIKAIFLILKDHRPLLFYSLLAGVFAILSLWAGAAPILDYYRESYVHHVPLSILAAALGSISIFCLGIGVVLQTICNYQKENYLLWLRSREDFLQKRD